jgi:hypothetical protein
MYLDAFALVAHFICHFGPPALKVGHPWARGSPLKSKVMLQLLFCSTMARIVMHRSFIMFMIRLPPSSAKIKYVWSYTSTPVMSSWHGALLSTGNFTFILYLKTVWAQIVQLVK